MSYFGSTEWYQRVAAGLVPGHSLVHKYGRNANGSISTEAAVTSDGTLVLPSSASTVRIKAGGNVNDTAAGTGAREVTVQGSDASGEFLSETIATAGASASSATTGSFLRVYRAWVSASGAYATDGLSTSGTNQDDIVIEDSGGANDLITITQYEGQTQYAAYHIPSDKTGYLLSVSVSIDGSKAADVRLYTRGAATDASVPVQSRRLKLYFDGVSGMINYRPVSPQSLGSDTDVWCTFEPTANGTECSVDFEMLLIDN